MIVESSRDISNTIINTMYIYTIYKRKPVKVFKTTKKNINDFEILYL